MGTSKHAANGSDCLNGDSSQDIQPEPPENRLGFALWTFLGLRLYFTVYRSSPPNRYSQFCCYTVY